MQDCIYSSLTQISQQLITKKISAEELTQACLDHITQTEPILHAFITTCPEQALAKAKELDASKPDPSKPLWGIPVSIKDNILTKGILTTAASRMLKNYIPTYDAFVVECLKKAGAIIIGKTNMDEFGMGSSTETSIFGPTYNPWNTKCSPGGSSGGSAASISSYQCFASLGTDTGGSIRQPAALSGCVGLKPTYGRVSRYGVISYGSSFDQVGPLTRTVEDAAIMLSVLAKHDPRDTTSSTHPCDTYTGCLNRQDLSGVKIGIPYMLIEEGIDKGVLDVYNCTIEKIQDLGAKVIDIELPHAKYAVATYYTLAMAEASSNLSRFDGIRYGYSTKHANTINDLYTLSRTEGFGEEVQKRILLGAYVLSSKNYTHYYHKAAQIRRLIQQDFVEAFKHCTALLTPVSPIITWPVGTVSSDPLMQYLKDIFTVSLNLAGLPGISIPIGLSNDLPVGVQLIGNFFDESSILSIGNVLYTNLAPKTQPIV